MEKARAGAKGAEGAGRIELVMPGRQERLQNNKDPERILNVGGWDKGNMRGRYRHGMGISGAHVKDDEEVNRLMATYRKTSI